MASDYEAHVELVKRLAKETIEGSGTTLSAKGIMLTETHVGLVSFDDVAGERIGVALKKALDFLRPSVYMLLSEVWTTTSKRPQTEGIAIKELPLDDREELVLLIVVERPDAEEDGAVTIWQAVVDDTPTGRRLREFTRRPANYKFGNLGPGIPVRW